VIERSFEVNAPPEICYRVAWDVESYPEFLKATKAARVIHRNSDESFEAEFEIDVMKRIKYRLAFTGDAPREIRWTFSGGEVLKDNRGHWRFDALANGTTQVHYGVDVKFGFLVPKTIVQKLTEAQLPTLLKDFQSRMEKFAHE